MDVQHRIIFVYNADSGPFALLKDYVHKIVSPDTYPCSLCQITFGNLGMKRAWRRFVQALPYPAVFLHRDELAAQYPALSDLALPAVILDDDGAMRVLVSAEELDRTPELGALQALVLAGLRESAQNAPAG